MALLTWYESSLATQSAATAVGLVNDLNSLISANVGNANFTWEVANFQVATSPYSMVLKPKSLGPAATGPRILLLIYTSAPAGVNPDIFDASPTLNELQVMYFPNSTTDTASNLTSATGAVMGNDAGCVKSANMPAAATTMYASANRLFYFDSADALTFGCMNPASVSVAFAWGGGLCVQDYLGTAYGACWATAAAAPPSSSHLLGAWTPSSQSAGTSATALLRTNYGSSNRAYFDAWQLNAWLAQANGSAGDVMANLATSYAYFCPIPLMGQTKGEGIVLKFRQMAWGPTSTVAFQLYQTTGPVTAAVQACNATAGSSTAAVVPWMTNFAV